MPRYYLSGGRQRISRLVRREEWTSFESAVLLELDTDCGKLSTVLEYQGTPGRVPPADPSHIFKTASWDGEHLLLCTQTEVLVFDPARRVIVRTISHPGFNDVHHVARINGRIHVVSTGLDCIFVLDENDQVVETHGVAGPDPYTRFDRAIDYRRVATTKPHQAHPNFVFSANGVRWATRFEQKDAFCLDDSRPPMPVAPGPIHDGVPHEGRIWFTAVTGRVVALDAATGGKVADYDLNTFPRGNDDPLGWCRGILIEPERTLVGFSRLRPTLFKQNLSWLRQAVARPEPAPTRVTAYDLAGGKELEHWLLEPAGMSAVFGILRV